MIESVAGAIAKPMPTPMMTSTERDERVAAVSVTNENTHERDGDEHQAER